MMWFWTCFEIGIDCFLYLCAVNVLTESKRYPTHWHWARNGNPIFTFHIH